MAGGVGGLGGAEARPRRLHLFQFGLYPVAVSLVSLLVSLCLSVCVSLIANRASKTRYLQQARNAKAMADALGYSGVGVAAEPVSPKQAAMDAAMAYKAAKHDAETPAEFKPRKRKVQCDIVNAEPEMAEELTTIVNWAYRVLTILTILTILSMLTIACTPF